MNKNIINILVYFFIVGCSSTPSKISQEELIHFDLMKDYPEKEFMFSDFLETTYIPVETPEDKDRMITDLYIPYIDNEKIIGFGIRLQSIFFIDYSGKILKTINKHGNGGKEYVLMRDMFYDARRKEFYILDTGKNRVLVLNENGDFLRNFYYELKDRRLRCIRDYDKDRFITQNNQFGQKDEFYGQYTIFSKKNGKALRDIKLPFKERRTPYYFYPDNTLFYGNESPFTYRNDYLILSDSSCDTIYKLYPKNDKLVPYVVKSPPINTQDKNKTSFLYAIWETNKYLIFNKMDAIIPNKDAAPFFKYNIYYYDKAQKKIFKSFSRHKDVYAFAEPFSDYRVYNNNIHGSTLYNISLKIRLERNTIYGEELKKIAENLKEEDNPVIMILKRTD